MYIHIINPKTLASRLLMHFVQTYAQKYCQRDGVINTKHTLDSRNNCFHSNFLLNFQGIVHFPLIPATYAANHLHTDMYWVSRL